MTTQTHINNLNSAAKVLPEIQENKLLLVTISWGIWWGNLALKDPSFERDLFKMVLKVAQMVKDGRFKRVATEEDQPIELTTCPKCSATVRDGAFSRDGTKWLDCNFCLHKTQI